MGIYLSNMEMPTSEEKCKFFQPAPFRAPYCVINGVCGGLEDCPLVPVPPHGRLIEAEPIMKFITDGLNSGEFGYDQIKVLTEIRYAPTIIPAEEGET